jgi:hypothetical protein
VRPKGFAIVNPQFKSDRGASSATPLVGAIKGAVLGRVQVVEALRDSKKKAQVDFLVEVVDASNNVVYALGPQTVNLALDKEHLVFALPLEAAGEYTLRLTATDKATEKTSTLEFPLAIVDPFAAPPARLAAKEAAAETARE